MADVELVIKISEEDYQKLKAKDKFYDMYLNYYEKLIVNGIPLPKGHGKLKDVDDIGLIDEQFYATSDYYVAESAIKNAPIIIDADKESD